MTTKTVTTLPLDTKSIKPKGSCLFCIPLKPGALAISIVNGGYFLCWAGRLITGGEYAQGTVYAAFAVLSLIGAYMIQSGNYRGSFVHAGTYAATHIAAWIMNTLQLMSISCDNVTINGEPATPEDCPKVKWLFVGLFSIPSLFALYFSFVLFQFAARLRLAIAEATNNGAQV